MAGAECCENPPVLDVPLTGFSGHVETLADIKVYVSGSPHTHTAIILVSDVYGFEAPNLRKLADKVAACGYYVMVPDYFHGDPYVRATTGDPVANQPEWLSRHRPAEGFEDSKKLIGVLNSRGITAIGASGFCWGAKVVVELAKGDYIKAGVLLHPSLVPVDDFKVTKAPMAILGAEFDHITPPEIVAQYEAILSTRSELLVFLILRIDSAFGSDNMVPSYTKLLFNLLQFKSRRVTGLPAFRWPSLYSNTVALKACVGSPIKCLDLCLNSFLERHV